MNHRIDLRTRVSKALGREWNSFAAEHPSLSKLLDYEMVVEAIEQSLDDDPEFQRVLGEARRNAAAIESIDHIVRTYVRPAFSRLLRG
jgi:hypothetical protein